MSDDAPPPPAVDAIVLAAGEGRRLGRPKALLEVYGQWMLTRLVRSLRAGGCRQVVVVIRAELIEELGSRGGTGADEVVVNPNPAAGRTGSILRGLEVAQGVVRKPDAALIHPADIPLLGADAVQQLIGAWRAAPSREGLAARLVTPGGRGGHPLLLGADRLAAVAELRPDQSLREVLHAAPEKKLDVVRRGDPGPFLDVDTPEQLALLETLIPGN